LLVPSDESKYVIESFKLAESGLYKQTEIVEKLKQQGFKNATKNIVNRILRNPLYAGLIKSEWNPEYIKAIHLAIITEKTFFTVQNILDGKKPAIVQKTRNHPDFPLRNYIRCPECGEKLTGGWSKGRNAKYPYYHCRTKGCSLNIRKEVLENNFYNYLKTFQPDSNILELFEAIVLDVWKNKQAERSDEMEGYKKELKALNDKKDRMVELLVKGTLDDQTYKTKMTEIENEIITKKIEVNDTSIELNDIEACLNYCKFFLANIADLWFNADLNLKQRFQTLIFPDKIYINQESFRTTVICLIFKELQKNNADQYKMVAPSGFEPESPP
jgi:site-specific DNA recombinase